MANQYVEKLIALMDRVQPKLPHGKAIEVKPFFGGAAGYVDRHIFISLTKVGLALKLPEEDREKLFRSKRAKKMRYFPKAPVKKQYALMSKNVLKSRRSIGRWIDKSLVFVLALDD